jgi:hypothetical protein
MDAAVVPMAIVVGLVLAVGIILIKDLPILEGVIILRIEMDSAICETLAIASPEDLLHFQHRKKSSEKRNIWLCW